MYFGSTYIAIWLATIFRVDLVSLHQIVTGPMVFLAPLGAYLLVRSAFAATAREALLAVVAVAGMSQLVMTVCLQSLGAICFTAVMPGLLACWNEATQTARPRLLALAALVSAATAFAYYAAFPVVVAMAGVSIVAAVWQRRLSLRLAAIAAIGAVLVYLLSSPRIAFDMAHAAIFEASSGRLQARLAGSEVLRMFASLFTEWYLPSSGGSGIHIGNRRSIPFLRRCSRLSILSRLSSLRLWPGHCGSSAALTLSCSLSTADRTDGRGHFDVRIAE